MYISLSNVIFIHLCLLLLFHVEKTILYRVPVIIENSSSNQLDPATLSEFQSKGVRIIDYGNTVIENEPVVKPNLNDNANRRSKFMSSEKKLSNSVKKKNDLAEEAFVTLLRNATTEYKNTSDLVEKMVRKLQPYENEKTSVVSDGRKYTINHPVDKDVYPLNNAADNHVVDVNKSNKNIHAINQATHNYVGLIDRNSHQLINTLNKSLVNGVTSDIQPADRPINERASSLFQPQETDSVMTDEDVDILPVKSNEIGLNKKIPVLQSIKEKIDKKKRLTKLFVRFLVDITDKLELDRLTVADMLARKQ